MEASQSKQVEQSLVPKLEEFSDWSVANLDRIMTHWLSTGTNLLSPYPKTYEENIAWRLDMLRKADKDDVFRQKLRHLFFADPLFAFNAFFYTLDVRKRPRHNIPFMTYPYQDLIILALADHIRRGEDLGQEKSRDMGASWLTISTYVWFWLHPEGGYDFLLGSRIEDYVDKRGDMRTLFEKARYLITRLPWWLMPKGWNPSKHDNFMKLINPESLSSITGESNNANFSTGGRYKSILLDEFGKWKDTDASAWTATADASPCRVPVSTPFGAFGQYFQIISDGKTKKLTIHWSLHPEKGAGLYCPWPKPADLAEGKSVDWLHWKGEKPWLRSPWYDSECRRRDNKTIAQELDIDYIGAGSPVFVGSAASRIIELMRSTKEPKEIYQPVELADGSYDLVELKTEEVTDLEDRLVVYEVPSETSQEVLGVDVVEGKEHGDYAVIKGLNRETRNCSFSYYARCDEVILARILVAINRWICLKKVDQDLEPTIAIETNGPGLSTFDLCVEYGLTSLFLTPNYDSVRESIVYQKGWKTTSTSRKKLVSAVKEWLIASSGWVDPRATREMTSFVYKNPNRPEAASGANDDEVIAWGIALAVDEILPGGEWQAPVEKRPDGLPANLFNIEDYRVNEPTSIQARCENQAIQSQLHRAEWEQLIE